MENVYSPPIGALYEPLLGGRAERDGAAVSEDDPRIPERVREYFGHDKVAHKGSGGMPAAPPGPARVDRAQGRRDRARLGPQHGRQARPPAGRLTRRAPAQARDVAAHARRRERALMEASQRRFGSGSGHPAPHATSGWFWRWVFAPVYRGCPGA